MWFDPFDNLFGSALIVWVVVGLIWIGGIWFFRGRPDWATRKGRAHQRDIDEARKERERQRREGGLDW